MSGLNGTITIEQQRRPATVNIPEYWAKKYGIEQGPTPCHVQGIFQGQDGEWSGAVAACELYDGRLIEVTIDCAQYTDTARRLLDD